MPFYVGNVISRAAECDRIGVVDPSFIDPNFNATVKAIAIQADNKILVGGDFTTVNGVTQNFITRLNYDGTLDTTFNIGGTRGVSSDVRSIAVQPDQKIVIVGTFLTARGVTQNRIARLNTDGSLDTSFNTGANPGFSNFCNIVKIQPDGKIIVGGFYNSARGVQQLSIARLNTDGSLDTSFNTGANVGTNDQVLAIEIQPDNKIIIGGFFTTARGVTQNGFARLNTDGSLDTSFNTGANPGIAGGQGIYDMTIQSDGKIVIIGDWTSFRGTTLQSNSPKTARSNTNGTRDTTWVAFPEPDNGPITCKQQFDGKIFIGGFFGLMRGANKTYFARLGNNGSLDTTYNVAPPAQGVTAGLPGGYVYSSAVQDDCRILIGGAFTEVRGITRRRLCRLA
jgi:uncharacterized delta-60 repeat protein